jgi:para-nitrobenzyl esterase
MNRISSRRSRLAAVRAAVGALILATVGATVAATAVPAAASGGDPIVRIDSGAVRGVALPGGYAFRGMPYAAPPTGQLRWRPPRRPAAWNDIRDATQFGPSCPQVVYSPFLPAGPLAEDCLYLNVSTPTLHHDANRPVLVWIHGGGLTQDAGRSYDGTKLAAEGTVVVTINYRLGMLGFLAHPALAPRPGGPTGNYGLMDQQAALRWVQHNIAQFGGNPHNVTIAGQSAGGLSVLAHLVSRDSRGLFQRAIVHSGAFALTQQPLATAEAAGKAFADAAGCTDQTARCLRQLSVDKLVVPGAAIPGVIDGKVLTESVGTALAAGRFARVPILNGIVHDEERLFVMLGIPVSGGTNVQVAMPTKPETYQTAIATAFAASPERAAAIAAEYPLASYTDPGVAFSTLLADANFACPALQVDRWTSRHVATFGYQFDDDAAPHLFTPPGFLPPVATHGDELQYLFDLPNAPFPASLDTDQQRLAATMRTAWARFAANGNPSSADLPWPTVGGVNRARVMWLVPPQPQLRTDYSAIHHCSFWATR